MNASEVEIRVRSLLDVGVKNLLIPLSTRLALVVGLPAALFLSAVLAWVAAQSFQQIVEQPRASALDLARLQPDFADWKG